MSIVEKEDSKADNREIRTQEIKTNLTKEIGEITRREECEYEEDDKVSSAHSTTGGRSDFHFSVNVIENFEVASETKTLPSTIRMRGDLSASMIHSVAKVTGEDAETLMRRFRHGVEQDFVRGHCFGNDYALKDLSGKACVLYLVTPHHVHVIHDLKLAAYFDNFVVRLGAPCIVNVDHAILSLWIFACRSSRRHFHPGNHPCGGLTTGVFKCGVDVYFFILTQPRMLQYRHGLRRMWHQQPFVP